MVDIATIGGGLIIGFLIGWAIRKTFSIILMLLGLYCASLLLLAQHGIIIVNWSGLESFIMNIIMAIRTGAVEYIIGAGVFGISLGVGALMGFAFSKSLRVKKKYRFIYRSSS